MVKMDGMLSECKSISTGVPQGSILGPLLFILYINDLPACIRESNSVIYADDTTIFASSSIPGNIEYALNEDMKNVCKWFRANRLKLNVDKTQLLVIYPNKMRDRFDNINIFVQGRHVQRESHIKVLGVHLEENLKWAKHIQIMLRNVKYQYRAYSRSIKYFDKDTRLLMYNSAIASRLNYADSIWSDCTLRDRGSLQTVQNMAIRRMVNARPLESCKPILANLGMLTLERKRNLRSLVLFYNLVNGRGPVALRRELHKYQLSSIGQHGTRMNRKGGYANRASYYYMVLAHVMTKIIIYDI